MKAQIIMALVLLGLVAGTVQVVAAGSATKVQASNGASSPLPPLPNFGSGEGSNGEGAAEGSPEPEEVPEDEGVDPAVETTAAEPTPQPSQVDSGTTTTSQPPSPPPAETVTTTTTSVPKAPQSKSDGTEAQPTAAVLPPPPQPPHAGYCDATGKFYELEIGQYKTDPFWAAKGPWTDAYRDPVTGSLACDMPKKEPGTPASMPNPVTPEASVTQLKAEPPPRLKPEPKRRIPVGVPIPAPPG